MQVYYKPDIIPPGTVMNATINSQAMQLENMFGYSIQVVYTGTPTGTFKLQASDDRVPQMQTNSTFTPVNWTDVLNSSQAVAAAGSFMWNVSEVMYNFVRVVYTDGSSGASTAIITVAQFNGKGV